MLLNVLSEYFDRKQAYDTLMIKVTVSKEISCRKDYEDEDLRLADLLLDPAVICRMDYRTTTNRDYRLPYPPRPRTPPPPPPPEPWLLNRRTIGYDLQTLENRHGYHKFLDDDMGLHRRIAELKMRRGKLHEIS